MPQTAGPCRQGWRQQQRQCRPLLIPPTGSHWVGQALALPRGSHSLQAVHQQHNQQEVSKHHGQHRHQGEHCTEIGTNCGGMRLRVRSTVLIWAQAVPPSVHRESPKGCLLHREAGIKHCALTFHPVAHNLAVVACSYNKFASLAASGQQAFSAMKL